jgi:hypothetical protein
MGFVPPGCPLASLQSALFVRNSVWAQCRLRVLFSAQCCHLIVDLSFLFSMKVGQAMNAVTCARVWAWRWFYRHFISLPGFASRRYSRCRWHRYATASQLTHSASWLRPRWLAFFHIFPRVRRLETQRRKSQSTPGPRICRAPRTNSVRRYGSLSC